MAQTPSDYPEDIQARQLGGLDERSSPANLQIGSFSYLEGLYQNRAGLLQRVPGKTLLATNTGGILQISPTYNSTQDVLVQTKTGRWVYTLDELLGRAVSPALVFPSINEEETMSYALLAQIETNSTNGGSVRGIQSSADASSLAKTFYGRRLTNKLVDDASIISTFTASTGGGAGVSTAGTFALPAGTYRVTVSAMFVLGNFGVTFGLFNVTDNVFQSYAGTSIPIVSVLTSTSGTGPVWGVIEAEIIISGTKTFQINQESSVVGSNANFGGTPYLDNAANVNGASVQPAYTLIKVLKSA